MNQLECAPTVCTPIDLGELSQILHSIERDPGFLDVLTAIPESNLLDIGELWLHTGGIDPDIADWLVGDGVSPSRPCDERAVHAQPLSFPVPEDHDLLPLGLHFQDATLTLSRNGAGQQEDRFMAFLGGALSSLAEGQPIEVDEQVIGLVTRNSEGVCQLRFNAHCSMACMDTLMSQLICSSPTPAVQESDDATNWTFCCPYQGRIDEPEEHIFVGCAPRTPIRHTIALDIVLS